MEILSVLLVGSIVTWLMYQNINRVTANLAPEQRGSFESYAAFAAAVGEEIRRVKNSLDPDIETEHPLCEAKPECDRQKAVRDLLDLLRESAFYETVMAKRKKAGEIEAALASILSRFDAIVRECCSDGEALADRIRETLHEAYQAIER